MDKCDTCGTEMNTVHSHPYGDMRWCPFCGTLSEDGVSSIPDRIPVLAQEWKVQNPNVEKETL